MNNLLLHDTLERTTQIIGKRANIKVICRGNDCPRTDGKAIILPSLPSPCPPAIERMYHGVCDHELAHVLISDFKWVSRFRKKHGEHLFGLFNVVEDVRIEAWMSVAYPGSEKNLRDAYDVINQRWVADMATKTLWQRMQGCLFTRGKGFDNRIFGADAEEAVDLVNDLITQAAQLKNTREAAKMAEQIIERWQAHAESSPQSPKAQAIGKALHPPPDGELQNVSGYGLGEALSAELGQLPASNVTGSYRIYTRDFDEVRTATGGNIQDYQELLSEVRPLVAGMRQRLLMTLRAERQSRIAPDENGSILHKKRLHQLLMPVPKAPLASKVKAPAQDVAVSLLVDLSGSMRGPRLRLAQRCAIILSEVMDQLSFPLEVIGFTTACDHGKAQQVAKQSGLDIAEIEAQFTRFLPLLHVVYKAFGENLKACRARLTTMVASDYTPINESVVFAGRRLLSAKASRRLLIVLTDGAVFLGSKETQAVAEQNLRDNLKLLAKAGVDVTAIGIQTNEVIASFASHIVVNDLAELPHRFFELLTSHLLHPRKAAKQC